MYKFIRICIYLVQWEEHQMGFYKDLYQQNSGRLGYSMANKIKYEHIHLTNFSKMRVDWQQKRVLYG